MRRCRPARCPAPRGWRVAMGVVAFGLDIFAGRRSLHLPAGRSGLRGQYRRALRDLRADILVRRPPRPDRGQHRAVAVDRRGDRTVSLSHRVSTPRPYVGLVLLIAAVGCHLALQGFGLLFFGAEGQRGPPISTMAFSVGPLRFTGQSIAVYAITIAFIIGLCCSSVSRSMARRCAPPPSIGWARVWLESGPRCRDSSHS